MLPVIPTVVFLAQAQQAPRYFTNAENVRRIAAGKSFVAFATSGGVRVVDRASQTWRVYTKNDGLPTHNIHDIVFDSVQPDKLWILCGSWGDWALDHPEPDLQLVTLELGTGKVELVAPAIAAPRTARRGYQFFLDYRLSVSESWAFVFTEKGAALAWDRSAKKWQRDITIDPTPARPSRYQEHANLPLVVGAAGDLIAFYLIPRSSGIIFQSQVKVEGGKTFVLNKPVVLSLSSAPQDPNVPLGPYVLLFNAKTGRATRHPLPPDLMGQSVVYQPPSGGTPSVSRSGRPVRFLPDTRPGSLLIESYATETPSVRSATPPSPSFIRVLHRLTPSLAEPVEVSREPITLQQRQRGLSAPPLVYWTDFLVDGDRLWVSGYNDPNRERTSGIAWLDLATGKWDGPKVSTTGLPANFVNLDASLDQVHAVGGYTQWMFDPQRFGYAYASSAITYDPVAQEFQRPTPPKPSQPGSRLNFRMGAIVTDPRATGDPERLFEWASLTVLGGDEKRALVLGPATAARLFMREGNNFKRFSVKYDTLFFYDLASKALTKLEVRGLEGLTPKAAGFTQGALFFLTEERAPGERRGVPVVLRWDTETGELKRYAESLFRDVSVAEQRNAGARQQSTLKRQQRERDERQRRNPNRPQPPIDLRPIGEFVYPLQGSFLKAAGLTWLKLDRHLFRYDPQRDTWVAEGTADTLSPEGESALWKTVGPEPWRFEFSEVQRLRTEVFRWSSATRWQKLELGDNARPAGFGLVYQSDALWLSGVGVLRIPKEALRFK